SFRRWSRRYGRRVVSPSEPPRGSLPELGQRMREVVADALELVGWNCETAFCAPDHGLARFFGGFVVSDPVRGDAELVEDCPIVNLLRDEEPVVGPLDLDARSREHVGLAVLLLEAEVASEIV